MVVVPALSKSDDRYKPIITTLVPGVIFLLPKHVGEGIDRKCGMVKKNGGKEKSPGKHRESIHTSPCLEGCPFTKEVATKTEKKNGNPIIAVDEAEFLKFCPVRNFLEKSGQGIVSHEPESVTPEKILVVRRMGVVLGVGVPVMHSVVSCPPKGAALPGSTSDEGS